MLPTVCWPGLVYSMYFYICCNVFWLCIAMYVEGIAVWSIYLLQCNAYISRDAYHLFAGMHSVACAVHSALTSKFAEFNDHVRAHLGSKQSQHSSLQWAIQKVVYTCRKGGLLVKFQCLIFTSFVLGIAHCLGELPLVSPPTMRLP